MVAGNDSRVYDTTMTYQGRLLGATFNGLGQATGVIGAHPTLFEHYDGQHVVLLTFDATRFGPSSSVFSWGQPNIQISTPYS
ncbi:MAG: hypothetical protein ACREEB_00880 [Caulobacteraceae bacterium]